MFSLIEKHRPAWVIGENVAGFATMGFEYREPELESKTVRRNGDIDSFNRVSTRYEKMLLDDCSEGLEKIGYQVQPFIIPACALGAPHRRDRVWIVAWNAAGSGAAKVGGIRARENSHADGIRQKIHPDTNCAGCEEPHAAAQPGWAGNGGRNAGHASIKGFPDWSGGEVGMPGPVTELERSDGREIERDFRGIPHGISNRVDRIRALGNTVIPQIPEIIGHAILEAS
jgi:site-specific DNA-cytosine methylase